MKDWLIDHLLSITHTICYLLVNKTCQCNWWLPFSIICITYKRIPRKVIKAIKVAISCILILPNGTCKHNKLTRVVLVIS